LNKHFAIGNFMSDCLLNRPIIIKGDGTPIRSYLYSADLIIWLFTILIKGENCRPYNVGSEVGISIESLARTIAALTKDPLEIKILTRITSQSGIEKYLPSTKRAQNELGLCQFIDINDSIQRTLIYHKASYEINKYYL
jgi:dTDP-glucose 4,6-dehydratase